MAGSGRIEVTGLREFRSGLRRVDRGLPREVRVILNKAAEIVVDEARPRVPVGPPPRGHAFTSVRSASTQSSGRVKGGGARFPYYPWLEFGGRVGRNNSVERTRTPEGRYIFPAFEDKRDEVREEMRDGLRDLVRRSGLRVRVR